MLSRVARRFPIVPLELEHVANPQSLALEMRVSVSGMRISTDKLSIVGKLGA
jgi:hypothetical protein